MYTNLAAYKLLQGSRSSLPVEGNKSVSVGFLLFEQHLIPGYVQVLLEDSRDSF